MRGMVRFPLSPPKGRFQPHMQPNIPVAIACNKLLRNLTGVSPNWLSERGVLRQAATACNCAEGDFRSTIEVNELAAESAAFSFVVPVDVADLLLIPRSSASRRSAESLPRLARSCT